MRPHLRAARLIPIEEYGSGEKMRYRPLKLFSYFILVLGVGIGVWGAFSLKKIETQYSVRQFLPDDHPSYELDQKVKKQFQLAERPAFFIVLHLKEPGTFLEESRALRLLEATSKLETIDGVSKAFSVASINKAFEQNDSIFVGNLLKNTPPDQWHLQIVNDPLISPTLITKDARRTSIIVEIDDMNLTQMGQVQNSIRVVMTEAFPETHVEIGGAPAVQSELSSLLNKELALFLIISAIVCALTIFLIFKDFTAVVIPFFLNVVSNLAVLGWMVYLGIPFTVMSTTVPIMIFVTVTTMCVHLMLRVNEETLGHEGLPLPEAIFKANKELFVPNFLGPLTTLLGFLTLLITDVPALRQYGWTVIGGVVTAWALTQLLIIPLLLVFPRPRPRAWTQKKATWLFPILRRYRLIVVSVTLTCVFCLVAGLGLQWTARVFDDLPENHEARRSTETIDRHLGGAIPLEVVITGNGPEHWNDPARVSKLDELLRELRSYPAVGTAIGLPEFLRSGDLKSSKLPDSRPAVAELYFIYDISGASPLLHYLNADGRTTRLSLRLQDIPANQLEALTLRIKKRVSEVFSEETVEVTGMAATIHSINNSISAGLIFDFWQALLITSFTLILVFRSWRWAFVSCLPNIIPPIALLGFLGMTGTPIKPIVAMIFSVVLGLAFGNTVYMINRLRAMQKDFKGHLPFKRAFYLEGNPCMISTLIVASGFSVFLFSDFSINRTFGAYVLISVAAGIVGDVMYLPAFLRWWPGFVKRPKSPHSELQSEATKNGTPAQEVEIHPAA